jgi:hypothetical protein
MTPTNFGNKLATVLMKLFFWFKVYRFRTFSSANTLLFVDLEMQDKTYGWTVEMQLKVYANVFHIGNEFDIKNVGVSKYQEL